MHNKYLPHNWLNFKRLSGIWTVFFYATVAFGVYAAYNWILVLQLPEEYRLLNSAPLERIYGLAAGASLLAAVLETGILRVLKTLKTVKKAVTQK